MILTNSLGYGVYTQLNDRIVSFKNSLPLIEQLKNPSVADRHWEKLVNCQADRKQVVSLGQDHDFGPSLRLEIIAIQRGSAGDSQRGSPRVQKLRRAEQDRAGLEEVKLRPDQVQKRQRGQRLDPHQHGREKAAARGSASQPADSGVEQVRRRIQRKDPISIARAQYHFGVH